MKKTISIIVALSLMTSLSATSAHAGHHHEGGVHPLWIPVAVLSTLAAAVTFSQSRVIHEQPVYVESRRPVVYELPPRTIIHTERQYPHPASHRHHRRPAPIYHDEYGRPFEARPHYHSR